MKKKILTISLLVFTSLLMILSIYIGRLLREEPTSSASITTIRKTKAAAVTYKRVLALNFPSPTNTTEISPTLIQNKAEPSNPVSVTVTQYISPTVISLLSTVPSLTLTNINLSPTEIVLAKNYGIVTDVPLTQPVTNSSPSSVAKVSSLPESGWIHYSLMMFSVATIIIFISFLY